jgi:hypothetical protein
VLSSGEKAPAVEIVACGQEPATARADDMLRQLN